MPKKKVEDVLKELSTKVVTGREAAESALSDMLQDNWKHFEAQSEGAGHAALDSWNRDIWTLENGRLVNQYPITMEKMLKRMASGEIFMVPDGEDGDIRCISGACIGDEWHIQSMNAREAKDAQEKRKKMVKEGLWETPKEPDFLDKAVDFFCRLFGKRKEVCAQWDLFHKDTIVKERTGEAAQAEARKWFEDQEKEISKNFVALTAGLQKKIDAKAVMYYGSLVSPRIDDPLTRATVQRDARYFLRFIEGEDTRALTLEEVIGFRTVAGFAVALQHGKEGQEAMNMAFEVATRRAAPEQVQEFEQFQADMIQGKVPREKLNQLTQTMEQLFQGVDLLSREGNYLGSGLRMLNGLCNAVFLEDARYKVAGSTEFLLEQQAHVFGIEEKMRELAKQDNYETYESYTKALVHEAGVAIVAREFLKKVSEMPPEKRAGTAVKYHNACSNLELQAGNFAEANVKNVQDALDNLAGGKNQAIIMKIQNREKEKKQALERREEEFTRSQNWTTSAEVEARQQAAKKQNGGMVKK